MAGYGLDGPWNLTDEIIDENFTETKPGNYILCKKADSKGYFVPNYVGRSDNDLKDRLHKWVGKYKYFKAEYATSAQQAFEKECNHWHELGGPEGKLDNKVHPARPDGKDYDCPVNGCEHLKESSILGGWV